MRIVMAMTPVLFVGIIVLYVILIRLKHKDNRGSIGKKKSRSGQDILDSLIPLGMLFGCATGVIFGMIFSISLVFTVSLGAGIGYLFGFFAFTIYRN